MKIEELLARPEGKTLEFKQDLSSPKNILRTLTAFANTAGGVLLIGIEDGSKAVLGVEHPLDEDPMPEINPEELDFRVASGLLAGLQKWSASMAEALNLIVCHQGRLVLNTPREALT